MLGGVLYAALAAGETEILSPATVTAVGHNDDAHHLWVDIDRDGLMTRATCRLLIVADGARSRVRDLLGIAVRERDYRQSAVIANVSTAEPHRQQAYERFTSSGPLALLPMTRGRYSLVWTQRNEDVDAVLQLMPPFYSACRPLWLSAGLVHPSRAA
ncbi:MAG: FAD-dependent monooxygenase [Thiolinea sp.]